MNNFIDSRAQVLEALKRELVGPDPRGVAYDPLVDSIDDDWRRRRTFPGAVEGDHRKAAPQRP